MTRVNRNRAYFGVPKIGFRERYRICWCVTWRGVATKNVTAKPGPVTCPGVQDTLLNGPVNSRMGRMLFRLAINSDRLTLFNIWLIISSQIWKSEGEIVYWCSWLISYQICKCEGVFVYWLYMSTYRCKICRSIGSITIFFFRKGGSHCGEPLLTWLMEVATFPFSRWG